MRDGWFSTSLGAVCARGGTIQTGPFGSQLHASDYVAAGIPVVMPVNIGDGRLEPAGIARVRETDAARLARHRLREGDIVYSRRGDITQRALIHSTAVGWLCGTGCLLVRPGKSIDPMWLSYWLATPWVHEWLNGHAVGATMPNLNTSILNALPVDVPPLLEQRRIGGVLGALDDLIDSLEATCSKIDQLQRAVFRSRWDGSTRVPLSELGPIIMGQSPPGETYNESGEGLPFYQGVKDFGLRHPARRVYCTAPTRLAHEGDVLIAVRAPIGDTNVAIEDCGIGRSLAALASDRPSKALQALRCDPDLWSRFQSDGTVFAAVNKRALAGNLVPWVDDPRLETLLAPMDALFKECWAEAKQLRKQRDELLPLLLSGRVRVEDVAA